jgi:hypothetical protein
LLFVFPAALRMRLLALSGRRRLQARLIRLSFGLVLVLVTTLVVVILLVLLIVRLFTSDDGDDVGVALLQGLAQVPLSILFGDGDPNRRLPAQARWCGDRRGPRPAARSARLPLRSRPPPRGE